MQLLINKNNNFYNKKINFPIKKDVARWTTPIVYKMNVLFYLHIGEIGKYGFNSGPEVMV